jgi:GMP synthase PP-ATPase subunit
VFAGSAHIPDNEVVVSLCVFVRLARLKASFFPGPGLSIRILGDITQKKVSILQDVDAVFIDGLKSWGCTIKYGKLEQFFFL